MGTSRVIAAAALAAALLLGACGGGDPASSPSTTTGGAGTTASGAAPTTTVAATTSTTRSPESLKAALLQPGDLPGATSSPAEPSDSDLSACFPGNPLGSKSDPGEVDSPDFELTRGTVSRNYASAARVATSEQASAFVSTFASATGSACVVKQVKAFLAEPPDPIDASGLSGQATTVSVADLGANLRISGSVGPGGQSGRLVLEVIAFHKGPVVVLLFVGAFGGDVIGGQGVELARKIAGRLP